MVTWSALTAAAALLVGGCGTSTQAGPPPAQPTTTGSTAKPTPSGPPAQVLTVEQLGTAVGCTPQLAGQATDYRQANCTLNGDNFVFLDFATTDGQKAWLEYATMYGGVYLVGNRWVLSGKSKEYMQTLQTKLGGTIQERGPMGAGPATGGP